MKYVLYFYISTFRSMCAVPNMTVFFKFLNFELSLLLLLLLLLLLFSCPLSQTFSPLAPLLNQRWYWPLRLQVPDCSTFSIMCDVPIIAVFCSESVERFPSMTCKTFFKPFVAIPGLQSLLVWSFVISECIDSCILVSFLLPFACHFCPLVLPYPSVCMFSVFICF